MKEKINFIFVSTIFFVLFFNVFVSAEVIDYPNLRITNIKYEPYPAESGKYVDVFVKIGNYGIVPAMGVSCELDPEYPFSLDPDENKSRFIGNLPAKKDFLLDYEVRIDQNAVDGENILKLNCGMNNMEDYFVTHEISINIDSNNPWFAIGAIDSTPDEIKSDTEEIKLGVEIQNIGEGQAKLVMTELVLPEGFKPSDSYSDVYSIGNMEKDSSETAVFYIDTEKIESGVYNSEIIIRYKNDNNNQNEYEEQMIEMEIEVKESPKLSIKEFRAGTGTSSDSFTGYIVKGGSVVSPSDLSQGDSGELRIGVVNDGEEEAKSVSVKAYKDSTQPFEFDEVYDFVGNLQPGEEGEAVLKFVVDEDAVLKKYFVDVEMRYVEDNEVRTERDTVVLEVVNERVDYGFIITGGMILIVILGFVLWRKNKLPFLKRNKPKE